MLSTIKELIKSNFGTIITAIAAIVVAIIGNLGKKKSASSGTQIHQKSKGNNVTMIGIQNNPANEKKVTENGRKD